MKNGNKIKKQLSMSKMTNLIVVLTVICVAVGCDKVEDQKPIKISLNIWPGYAHAFIAQEKGFFKKNNVSVNLILKKDITESKRLYINGEVDGLFNVFPDIIMLNVEGINTKVVYIADFCISGDVIIGRPEFNSLTDLKGKKISFEGINSFSHIFVLRALDEAGIKEYKVQFESVPAMDVLIALDERKIDAGHTWEPVTTQAIKRGYKVLAKAGDVPGIIIDVLAFNANVIRKRPDDIRQIVKSLFEARDFIYSNRDEALKIMSKAEGISIDSLKEGIQGVHHPDIKENSDAMKKSGKRDSLYNSGKYIMEFYANRGQLSKMLDLDTVIEPKFIE